MRIRATRLISGPSGPNIYSHKPVLIADVDGPCDRLQEAVLHVASSVGAALRLVTPRVPARVSNKQLLLEYQSGPAALRVLQVAVEWVKSGDDFTLEAAIAELKRYLSRVELGPSTRAIVDAAERRGIPWRRVNEQNLVQLGYGRNRRFVEAALTTNTNCIAVDIAANKELTKSLLEAADIPVPRGRRAETVEEALDALKHLRAPYVVKPLDGCQGRGVSLHLRTADDVRSAFASASAYSKTVLVEEQLEGCDYRVLVINGALRAASLRTPAQVVGDGVQTIEQLIENTNCNPLRGDDHESALTKIHIDNLLLAVLTRCGLHLQSVPPQGQRVTLRDSANLSTGGEAKDVTDLVHPEIRTMCERTARIVGLDICGIDLIAADISQSLNPNGGIVEVNASPGLRMHLAPSEGTARDVGTAVVDSLYPRGRESRIPIVSVTGTNGKTTVTRMIAHVLQDSGQTVGMTTTDGIWIDGQCASKGDTTGPQSAWTVLSDPAVEVAVLETALDGIVHKGLGYDWADVAVITNIQADHLGRDGIQSMEDIFEIKSLVTERVRAGGTVVLNAEDPLLAALPSHPRMAGMRRRIVFFSMDWQSGVVQRHLAEGNTAFFVRDGWVVEATGLAERWIARVNNLPGAMGGIARHQVQNAMAAIAACRAQGVSAKAITTSIRTFRANLHNIGRGNLYRLAQTYVMVDYGHNPAAFHAMASIAANWPAGRVTGVVALPGDRTDDLIREAARAAADAFDRLIIREDHDLRGRKPGEVAQIIAREVTAAGMDARVCLDTVQAVNAALQELQPGDLVIIFYEHLDEVLQQLSASGAEPAEELPWIARDVLQPLFQPALRS
jgi:cyanophycin synthetase